MSSYIALGGAFAPPKPEPDDAVAAALEAIHAALLALGREPAEPTNRTEAMVEAVNSVVGLKGPATAEEIAEALQRRLAPATVRAGGAGDVHEAVDRLTKTLDSRLRGLGAAFGSGGVAHIAEVRTTETGLAQETTLANRATEYTAGLIHGVAVDIKRGIDDMRKRFDYAGGPNPIYVGKAVMGTADTAADWHINRFTWDAGKVVDIQYQRRSWSTRTEGWV